MKYIYIYLYLYNHTYHRFQSSNLLTGLGKELNAGCTKMTVFVLFKNHLFYVQLLFSLSWRIVPCSCSPFAVWCEGRFPLLCHHNTALPVTYTTLIIAYSAPWLMTLLYYVSNGIMLLSGSHADTRSARSICRIKACGLWLH